MHIRVARPIIAATAAVVVLAGLAWAQDKNPRFGVWKLKQDPPATNIMTYEPYGNGGMKITVEATHAEGRKTKWTYTTMFDGTDQPVTGDTRTEFASVKRIDAHTNEITNKRGGRVMQVVTNVLSADGNTINNTYKNYNDKGELTSTTTAVYQRIK
jgi:hypothetical protein